ncbi:Osmotin, thaumatin-like protein [Auricularia subglabra TFB-10046 SS5]|nr:Osmotin, thaumatin-like protein [Auricularia subglabra TFB-10046 SS5]
MQLSFLLSVASLALVAAADRTITVKNNCNYTIWPAVFTPPGHPAPKVETGWKAPPGHKKSFKVPSNWVSGRIWGRTGCDFSKKVPGPLQCKTGGCNGGLKCTKSGGGTGVPPATLAEWTLSSNGKDWYDVSLVDGFNIPMRLSPTGGCRTVGCKPNLNKSCPKALQHKVNGKVVGCKSSCVANGKATNCCSGSHNTLKTCPANKVEHYSFFKKACPTSYAYAYDEPSGTALWACPQGKKADYTVTFCPK